MSENKSWPIFSGGDDTGVKVINPKYSKHWLYTVAHTIDCVCSKILMIEIMGYFFYFSSFFGWTYILNLINLEKKTRKLKTATIEKVKELTHELTFYCTQNQLCVPQYKVNV